MTAYSCPGEPCVGCEVFAASLLLRGLLENVCGKVRAIAVVILKIEASFSASHQILGVVAGVQVWNEPVDLAIIIHSSL